MPADFFCISPRFGAPGQAAARVSLPVADGASGYRQRIAFYLPDGHHHSMSRLTSSSPLPPMLLAACPLPSFSGQFSLMSLPELPEGLPAAEDRAHMAAFRLPAEREKRHLARLLLAVLLKKKRPNSM